MRVHVIVGATGVGTTTVAERLARKFNAPIVVADRIQCFIDLAVTSARTPVAEEHSVTRDYLAQRQVRNGETICPSTVR